jgi:FlaA1/EpsC-like NDP-sugar epimerase
VRNNALATRVVAHVAGQLQVGRFVLVSTDKAVAPATVMGASKALAEFALEAASARWPDTHYNAVRFGNVLGSSGSVVPIFRRQIARGGPVTVTDERMTRYFMTIPEAVQLIIRSGSLGDEQARPTRAARAEVFVLDMGEPVRIVELARAMIELSGLDPDHDIDIEIVGARGGEKLHEQLFNSYERSTPTVAEKILLAERAPLAMETVEAMFAEIGLLVLEGDAAGLAAKVSELSATRHPDPKPEADPDPKPGSAAPDHEAVFVPGDPSPPARAISAPSASENPGAEELSGPDDDRDRHSAPAPLIHSRDS